MNLRNDFTNPYFKAVMYDITSYYADQQDNVVYMDRLFKIHGMIKWVFSETKGTMPKQKQLDYIYNLADDIMVGTKDILFDGDSIKIMEYNTKVLDDYESNDDYR